MSKRTNADILTTKKYAKRSHSGEIFHRVRINKGAFVGLIILAILLLTFIGSLFMPLETVTATHAKDMYAAPSLRLPFGADDLGRSILLRIIYGTRYSIVISLGVVSIGMILGVLFGSAAGFFGETVDNIIMRASDVLASIPAMLAVMVIMTALGQSLVNLIISMGITVMPGFIRITRASVFTVRNNEYIEAARAIGLSNFRIIYTHILPNAMSPVIVTLTTCLGMVITSAAALSFIGFGVPPPYPEWGGLVATGRTLMQKASWVAAFPGLAIMLVVLAFNMLGDGLRDALDPKMKGSR